LSCWHIEGALQALAKQVENIKALRSVAPQLAIDLEDGLKQTRPSHPIRIEKYMAISMVALRGTSDLLQGRLPMGVYQAVSSVLPVSQARDISKEEMSLTGHEGHQDSDCHFRYLLSELQLLNPTYQGNDDSININKQADVALLILLGAPPSIDWLEREIFYWKPRKIVLFLNVITDLEPLLGTGRLASIVAELHSNSGELEWFLLSNSRQQLTQLLHHRYLGCVGSCRLVQCQAGDQFSEAFASLQQDFGSSLRPQTGGPFVDELNMLRRSRQNLAEARNLIVRELPRENVSAPIILVASGPSLDRCHEQLVRNEGKALIVSAGSSLGTLLAWGIHPHFHVHVERGGANHELMKLYTDYLMANGLTRLNQTVGVVPTSIDTQLKDLYRECIYYFRGGQSPVAAFVGAEQAVLDYEGPECLSAAFSFCLSMRPQKLFLCGCDLGSADRSLARSRKAIGNSARDFDLRVAGNLSSYAWTNHEMMSQLNYMGSAYNSLSSSCSLVNISNGIKIPFAEAGHADLLDELLDPISHNYFENLLSRICLPSDQVFDQDVDDNMIVDLQAKHWLKSWFDLASEAPSLANGDLRMTASRCLQIPEALHEQVVPRLLRGTMRDAFFLMAWFHELYSDDSVIIENGWKAFERFLLAISLELDWLAECFEKVDD